MTLKFLFMLGILCLLSACAHPLGPQASGIEAPLIWNRVPEIGTATAKDVPLLLDTNAQVEHEWWKHFNDPALEGLITEALKNNKTLAIARARIDEARANVRFGHANQLPQIDGTIHAVRNQQGLYTEDKTLGVFEADIQATWEMDVFGRNLPRLAQAQAIVQSEEANRQAVMVELLAQIGRNYFDARNYRHQIEITQKNLENQMRTLDLTKAQQKGAILSDFDVQRADAQVSTTASQLPALQEAYEATLNHINILLGHPPGTKDYMLRSPGPTQHLDRHILVAAPAEVLANRPDVRAAERLFAAGISARQAAAKQFFPNISLLTLFGLQESNDFSTFPWSVGIDLVQPVLDFGRIKSQIDAADAQQQQAFLNYQQTVLGALENMENALSAYRHEVRRHALLRRSVAQNRKAANFARLQFKSGYTGLLDLLTAQRNVLDAESGLAASDAQLRKDLVNIYTASGGGWKIDGAARAAAPPAVTSENSYQ